MSGASRVDDDLTRRIDAACDQFEADWKAGRTPRIEDHLGSVPAAGRPELLRQLLAVELSYRRRRVEAPGPDEYRRRFPGHAELVDRAFERTVVVDAGRGPGRAGPGPTVDLGDRPVGDGEGPAESPGWIGKYHVVRPLGRGGQATALLAFDPDLERHVVLKRYHLGDGARAERALEEGRALARVSSPHVARCLGVERRGGEVLLVVEHVAGRDLERAYRERPPCPAAAARLVAQAAAGLAAVHACGLLHRDLKPANILRGDDGVARLVDFGLAAGVGSAALGELSGTPAYMAPEQARAEPERIGVRTDVFGLGAVLYCLLTGSPPYRGRDAGEILEQARQGRITPPRALNPRVPRALERICLQALAADPAARQATAAELAAQLQGFARGPRRAAGVAAVTGALLLAALGAWGGPRRPVAPAPTALATGPSLLRVERGRRPYELRDVLPVRTRDGLRVTCEVPHGSRPSLFWLDSEGRLTEVQDFHLEPGATTDRLTYPSPTEVFDLVGPPGTELALVCVGRDGPVRRVELEALLGASRPWPALPEQALLTVGREGIREEVPRASRGMGAIRPGLLAGVRGPLDRLQVGLRGRVTFLAGVAFPHVDDADGGRAAGAGPQAPPR